MCVCVCSFLFLWLSVSFSLSLCSIYATQGSAQILLFCLVFKDFRESAIESTPPCSKDGPSGYATHRQAGAALFVVPLQHQRPAPPSAGHQG